MWVLSHEKTINRTYKGFRFPASTGFDIVRHKTHEWVRDVLSPYAGPNYN